MKLAIEIRDIFNESRSSIQNEGNGHIYIVIKSMVIKLDGFSSNWHAFDGISKTEPSNSVRNTLFIITSKCFVEQPAGKQIPREILGPISNLCWWIVQVCFYSLFYNTPNPFTDYILSKIKMRNRFLRRKFQLANAVLCFIIETVPFDVEALRECAQIKEIPT